VGTCRRKKMETKRNSDNKPIIEAVDLMHYYDDGPSGEKEYSLQGVNLSVKEGEFLVVLGHNGSGKSTFAKHMNALLLPQG